MIHRLQRHPLVRVLCFLSLSLLIFSAALKYGFTMADDRILVAENLYIRGLTLENLRFVFTHYDPELYMPLTFVSYQIDYMLGGIHPWIYHATNIALHGVNAYLVAIVAHRLTKRRWISLLTAVLFCVHPIQTEAVVWIAGRKDLLSTTFLLGSLLFYLRYRDQGHRLTLLYSIITFLCALMAKASVMSFPLALVLLEVVLPRRRSLREVVVPLVPFVALSVLFAMIAWMGKGRVVYASTALETILMSVKSTVFYLEKLIWPTGLSPAYAYHGTISMHSPDFFVPMIVLGVVMTCIGISLRWTRSIAVTAGIFLAFLAPSFLNFHKGDVTYIAVDRYVYVAMIALALGFSESARRAFVSSGSILLRRFLVTAIVIAVVVLAYRAREQTHLWRTDRSIVEYALQFYPDSLPLRITLATLDRQDGRTVDEQAVLEGGQRYFDHVAYRTGIGSIFARSEQLDAAEREYKKGMQLDPRNPEPLFYQAALEEQRGHQAKALALYKVAISMDESYVAAYNNAGAILLDMRRLGEAEAMFRKAIEWSPSFMEGHYNLYQALALQRRWSEALPFLRKAYAANPDEPDIALALAYQLYEKQEADEARAILQRILSADPADRTARRLLEMLR